MDDVVVLMDCFEDLLLVEFTEELKLNVLRFFASDVIRSCFLLAPDVVAREYSSCTEKVIVTCPF